MFEIFKKSKTLKPNDNKAQKSIQQLEGEIVNLEEKIAFYENKKKAELQIAKKKIQDGDKEGAKRSLLKKKQFDESIKTFDGALMMLEQQKMLLESSQAFAKVLNTLKAGNDVLKNINKDMKIEDIERVKDDMAEIKENQDEINNFFKNYAEEAVGNSEVEDELNKLENQIVYAELPSAGQNEIKLRNTLNFNRKVTSNYEEVKELVGIKI